MAKSARTGRRRHLRHSAFSRFRTTHGASAPFRSDGTVGFWARRMTALTGTGTGQVFTAAAFISNEIAIAGHGYSDGDGPFVLSTAGTLPAGLELDELYFVSVVDANTLQLHQPNRQSIANAEIDFTDAGTGAHTITKASDELGDGESAGFQYSRSNRPETIEAATDVDDLT